MSLAETIVTGMNNPECAFYVGQSLGMASAGNIIFRVALVYYGVKLLDKLLFKGIPKFYDWARLEIKYRKVK